MYWKKKRFVNSIRRTSNLVTNWSQAQCPWGKQHSRRWHGCFLSIIHRFQLSRRNTIPPMSHNDDRNTGAFPAIHPERYIKSAGSPSLFWSETKTHLGRALWRVPHNVSAKKPSATWILNILFWIHMGFLFLWARKRFLLSILKCVKTKNFVAFIVCVMNERTCRVKHTGIKNFPVWGGGVWWTQSDEQAEATIDKQTLAQHRHENKEKSPFTCKASSHAGGDSALAQMALFLKFRPTG